MTNTQHTHSNLAKNKEGQQLSVTRASNPSGRDTRPKGGARIKCI